MFLFCGIIKETAPPCEGFSFVCKKSRPGCRLFLGPENPAPINDP
jgi:hypothetical protein